MAKNRLPTLEAGLNGDNLNELVDKPIDTAQAQAALDADRQARAREYGEILTREGRRLNCDLIAAAEIIGNQVTTSIRVIAR